MCIHLYTIINALNETEDAYSLELSPTFCRSVLLLVFFFVFVLVFFIHKNL